MSKLPNHVSVPGPGRPSFSSLAFLSSAALVVLGALSACTFRSVNPDELPPGSASSQGVAKSFFFETSTDSKTGRIIETPRTFLCGWAPEQGIGYWGERELTANIPIATHCNMIFQIEENALLGKSINPSFPNDPSRWVTIVTIPIRSHYYLDRKKDGRGRELPEFEENSSRSHWRERPYVKLDLSGMQIHDAWQTLMRGENGRALSVDDVEWDHTPAKRFLGFTMTTMASGYESGFTQGRFRINFLEFQHNPRFQSTPFHENNYRHLNVLHYVGQKLNGTEQVLKAGRWDLSKTHELHLVGIPPAYLPLAKGVVDDWNQTLQKVGAVPAGHNPFVIAKRELKHAFDLRYPSMVWIDDERTAQFSPLGVAMAHADVRNGEILWGGITLYGGYLEAYMRSYAPSSGQGNISGSSVLGSLARLFSKTLFPKEVTFPVGISDMGNLPMGGSAASPTVEIGRSQLAELGLEPRPGAERDRIRLPVRFGADSTGNRPSVSTEVLERVYSDAQSILSRIHRTPEAKMTSDGLRKRLLPKMADQLDSAEQRLAQADGPWKEFYIQPKQVRDVVAARGGGNIACLERTFAEYGPHLAAAAQSSGKAFDEVIRAVVVSLITHEYGHFLGLGHQFKENILPEPGSVPEKYIQALAPLATREKGFSNLTSVMGYAHPLVEFYTGADHLKPGPQDELVLRYLYRQEYPTFKAGDADFVFKRIPGNGVLPEVDAEDPQRVTRYFPQCNDMDASFGLDPFCNRFDRGSSAADIVANYFEDLNGNLVQTLFSLASGVESRSPDALEARLWANSFRTLGRTRIFYDYMRRQYAKEIEELAKSLDAEKGLFEFSQACQVREITPQTVAHPVLRKILVQNPGLVDLCRANALALKAMDQLVRLNAADFTRREMNQRVSPGGISGGEVDRNYNLFTGRWVELSALPLKLTSLYALTTPVPWVSFGGWNFPVFTYDDSNLKYSYSSLYPREYTGVIASNVQSNLRIDASTSGELAPLGSALLAMPFFSYLSQGHNDQFRFPRQYMKRIRSQTSFEFRVAAVLLDGGKGQKVGDPSRVMQFGTEILDLQSRSQKSGVSYLLPGGEVLATTAGSILIPLSDLILYDDQKGYSIALQINFPAADTEDPLERFGAKSALRTQYDAAWKGCVAGTDENGLSAFFYTGSPRFKGFLMPVGTARDEDLMARFRQSVREGFQSYLQSDQFRTPPDPQACLVRAMRGIFATGNAAALLNGFWLGSDEQTTQN